MDDIKYVSQEEFNATLERIESKKKAIKAAKRLVSKHKRGTLAEKIAANQILHAAINMKV